MPKIDVEEQLKLRFLQPLPACMLRRVVIWHYADGEFAPEFERLAAEGFDGAGADDGVMPAHGDFERPVRFVEACEGHMFAVKKLINRDDLASDILLYRRCPRGRLEGDWLADVELYADQFQADYLSLLADQLGIENIDAVRESLREHKTFFDAKTRCAKFAACVPHASGASDIELGTLTVIFGGKELGDARPAFVLRGCMTTLLHEGPEALAELVDKYCVRDVLSAFIVAMGLRGRCMSVIRCLRWHPICSSRRHPPRFPRERSRDSKAMWLPPTDPIALRQCVRGTRLLMLRRRARIYLISAVWWRMLAGSLRGLRLCRSMC